MGSQGELFSQFMSPRRPPVTDEEWKDLAIQCGHTFSPHAPIDDQSLFAGRADIMLRLIDTVYQNGRHAILYGERGVGKTSLTNIVSKQIFSKSKMVKIIRRNCTHQHDFRLMWVHALDDFNINGKESDQFLGHNPNP
jgi:Cdc6-like AAA superfamily ATPase